MGPGTQVVVSGHDLRVLPWHMLWHMAKIGCRMNVARRQARSLRHGGCAVQSKDHQ